MNLRTKFLLGASFAMIATPALAQTVESASPNGGTYAEAGFDQDATAPVITDVVTGAGTYDSTSVQTGTTDFTHGEPGTSNVDFVNGVDVYADVAGTYDTSETTVTHVDTVTPANTTTDPSTYVNALNSLSTFDVYANSNNGYFSEIDATTIVSDADTITIVDDTHATVDLTQTNSHIGADGISFQSYNGTATYTVDPLDGSANSIDVEFDTTPSGSTTLNASGLSTTGSINVTGGGTIANGTSYVTVNEDSVVIHGGTSSTTVTTDDAGFKVDLNDDGEPDFGALIDGDGNITGGIRGDWQVDGNLGVDGDAEVDGNLAVDGQTTTNGITNNGLIRTNSLNVTGVNAAIVNSAVNGVADAAPVVVADNFFVTGNTSTTNGNITTTNGNITATNGTVTGAALVSTGLTSVGTNLTVGGTSDLRGAIVNTSTTEGANNSVVVNDTLTVTGNTSIGVVSVNASTGSVSGLANATLSSTSTQAVTGQQLFATNNRVSALETGLTALTGRVDLLETNLNRTRAKAYQGVAMGFAMNAAPLNLANGEKGISGGVGVFQGEWAGAVKAQFVTESGFGIGANVGFSEDAVGGGVGASMKF